MTQVWEYRVERPGYNAVSKRWKLEVSRGYETTQEIDDLRIFLNQLGADGWELVSVERESYTNLRLWFKRPRV